MARNSSKPETIGIPELATMLADKHDLTKAKSKAMLDDLRDNIVSTILSGKRVGLFGLGTFEVRDTKEKMGRNPKTGEQIKIPAGRKVVFKASKSIKDQM